MPARKSTRCEGSFCVRSGSRPNPGAADDPERQPVRRRTAAAVGRNLSAKPLDRLAFSDGLVKSDEIGWTNGWSPDASGGVPDTRISGERSASCLLYYILVLSTEEVVHGQSHVFQSG
jgi:hypothetical protein